MICFSKSRIYFICSCLFLILSSSQAGASCQLPESLDELEEGKPVIRVSPIYPRKLSRKGTEGCAIIAYALKAESASGPSLLIPFDIEVVAASDAEFGSALKKAAEKWRFLPGAHPDYDGDRFYSRFDFYLKH